MLKFKYSYFSKRCSTNRLPWWILSLHIEGMGVLWRVCRESAAAKVNEGSAIPNKKPRYTLYSLKV